MIIKIPNLPHRVIRHHTRYTIQFNRSEIPRRIVTHVGDIIDEFFDFDLIFLERAGIEMATFVKLNEYVLGLWDL